ncbi:MULTISPECIES: substrate-binding domain-containing protein [unclassified Aureimonas]|uniref:substrate-binding domain-containing protein n=1 Tax=unclassified Aureimonas TaxID=2615206 RepID=UPI0006FF5102|nr:MULTISPECIES: substrate-binding domain-containing protein [unclassified Aureimonas]KQT69004.1 sugar ABC transporter substrate-binding protein [Aureimonas sp. Leaf460]KQT69234.1 sugar ABC transporter substrate-binding protein [Aureimonas sp. Leaf427]
MNRRSLLSFSAAALLLGSALAGTALSTGPAEAAGIAGAPAPFDKGGVKLALIVYLSGGDYYQNYEAGVKRQADALGIELRSFQGRQKPDEQREQIRQAINLGVDGIILAGGKGEAISDVVQEALDAGIKIAVQNVDLPQKDIITIDQDESKQLDLVLGQAVAENGEAFKAGYIYVEGFPALDKRDKVWQAFKASHPKVEQLAQWGAVDDTPAQTVANQTAAVFRAHPEINVILAPWDEFGRGAKIAVDENGLNGQVKIYSIDVSTSDIQAIREPNSAWVATAAISASGTGAAAVRAVALSLTGELKETTVLLPPTLITQKFLIDNDVKNEEELNAKLPEFRLESSVTADWIKAPPTN